MLRYGTEDLEKEFSDMYNRIEPQERIRKVLEFFMEETKPDEATSSIFVRWFFMPSSRREKIMVAGQMPDPQEAVYSIIAAFFGCPSQGADADHNFLRWFMHPANRREKDTAIGRVGAAGCVERIIDIYFRFADTEPAVKSAFGEWYYMSEFEEEKIEATIRVSDGLSQDEAKEYTPAFAAVGI